MLQEGDSVVHKSLIKQIENERLFLLATFTVRLELVFVLTQENPLF